MLKDQIQQHLEEFADWFKSRWSHIVAPLAVALTAGVMVQNPFQQEAPTYRAGEIARSDIKAPSKMLVVDEDLTQKKQARAVSQINNVYDLDTQVLETVSARVTAALEFVKLKSQTGGFQAGDRKRLEDILDTKLEDDEWKFIYQLRGNRNLERAFDIYTSKVYSFWITGKQINFEQETDSITVRDIFSEVEETVAIEDFKENILFKENISELVDRDQALSRQLEALIGKRQKPLGNIVEKVSNSNISFNQIETNARKEKVRSLVDPVVVEIAQGEMIIREGERVERSHLLLLEYLRNIQRGQTDLRSYLGFVSLIFFSIFILYWIGNRNFKRFRFTTKDRLVLAGFFVVSLALITVLNSLFDAAQVQSVSGISFRMLLPFAFVGMTLRLFSSIEITFFFLLLFSICVSWLLKDPYIGLTSLTVAMGGAASMRHITQRLDVLKAGFTAGVIQSLFICIGVIMGLTESAGVSSPWLDLATTAGLAVASGILSTMIVLFLQPVIEFIGYTTDLRLMELSNTNNPLLRELIMKAPGTYFHSFAVSQLSEKAAEAINANPLFARVASLYHDIGKLKKPQYFIENIKGENKHDKIVPSMSALIISNHVKEGIELGHSHKLPQAIINCIPQHHGTALISYFYEKAKKQVEEGEEIDERDFRYPGPKPQTKEAAIIMLADAVEATAKSMSNATQDQLRQKVNQTIRRFFLDGQLDECDLSLKDLNAIGSAFVSVLQGIYHQRIDYPHLAKEQKQKKVAQADDGEKDIDTAVKSVSSKNV